MSESGPSAPAGWYPSPEGGERYWDGQAWLSLPAPTPTIAEPLPSREGRSGEPHRKKRTLLWASLVVAAVVIAGGAVAITLKVQADQAAEAEAEAQAQAQAKAEAEEARQLEAEQAADQQERESRAATITEIEAAITTMADGHIAEGLIDGPVLQVSCDPVGGGSTDDLTQRTSVFQCFVANVDNGDGSFMGHYYNATMNWDSGQYTYGFGSPD